MFDTILIANRGEIACRIMRTAQAMGVRCVAVYSEVDAGAAHVAMANVAVPLGGKTPAESYLRGDAIIAAAQATGAEAIHPGYGFLSENPDFVEAVEAAGLTFIGPSAKAIRAMGLKDAAKALMVEAGVPVVPGYHGADQSPDVLAKAADEIGYPVLIKAVAGGGGKGMRQVARPEDFDAALSAAQSEGQAAFGNADVLVEKLVAKPRHIEVQVFGDGTQAIHLFERDCSLQRRHQKVIEEAPAPGMTEALRSAMGAAAVRAAEAIGYKGAGTVEFIVDASGGLRADGFYFMEMNTRLQVEHPVTEAITGVDLVEWQLRVAAGEALPMAQADLRIAGHAFEARLYAEDPANDFLPVTGRLSHLDFPEGCRVDSGVQGGDEISPYYDPMVAKVITHGATRAVALGRLQEALAGTQVAGTQTNLGFLGALAREAEFAAGDVDTGLIGRRLEALTAAEEPSPVIQIAAGQAFAGVSQGRALGGFSLWAPLRRRVSLRRDGTPLELALEVLGPDQQRWSLGEARYEITRRAGRWWLGETPLPQVHVGGGQVTVFGRAPYVFEGVDPLDRITVDASGAVHLKAPMPGLVRALFVEEGQNVSQETPLAILEAMKMEHTLTAPRDTVITGLFASAGDQVEAGHVLMTFAEPEDAA